MSSLGDLPSSNDEFWSGADVYIVKPKEVKRCEHQYVFRNSLEVVCTKCGVGYVLGVGFNVKDGHIYEGEKLVS